MNPVDYLSAPRGVLTFEELRRVVSTPYSFSRSKSRGAVLEEGDRLFDLHMAAANAGFRSAREYLYYCHGAPPAHIATIILPHWLASKTPLTPDQVVEFGLQPYHRAAAQFAIDGTKQLGITLELATDDVIEETTKVAVLFVNPRRICQLSFFDSAGPSGHQEHDPVEMVSDAIIEGYRWVSPGAVDRVMSLGVNPW